MKINKDIQNDELLYIHSEFVDLTIKGKASHPVFKDIQYTENDSSLKVSCEDYNCTISLSGDPQLNNEPLPEMNSIADLRIYPIFYEQQQYEIIIESNKNNKIEFWHDNYHIRKKITPVGKNNKMLTGVINFRNEIGLSDLIILVDGRRYLKITIEVFPSKINYKEDYKALISDVTSEVYSLLFDFMKKTYEKFGISDSKRSTPLEFFAIIKKIYSDFIAAADIVISKPHHMLESEYDILPERKIKRVNNRTVKWIEKHPEHVLRSDNSFIASKALAVRKYVTYDTKENRFTKYILTETVKRLENFKYQCIELSKNSRSDKKIDKEFTDHIDSMTKGIRRRINTGFFSEVTAFPANTGMSLVFSMAPGYRELFRCYQMLLHGLSVTGSIFNISEKDISLLYEYWCFIKLNSIMKEKYELVTQNFIKTDFNGLTVSLRKGVKSEVKYRNPKNGEIIRLSYNQNKINMPTVSQKPDNILTLKKKGSDCEYEYVFDAKYKINPALENTDYKKYYKTPGPQEEDINTMHRYRDAIVSDKNEDLNFKRSMFGAYVLFPYNNNEEYRSHHFYKSIEKVNIGGLPFLPSNTEMVTEILDELINDSPDAAFERATLPEGIEKRLAKVDWNSRDVLIGFVKDEEQFNFCYDNKFYYTYCKKISDERFPLLYVAMYMKTTGITCYGKIKTTQVVPRRHIPCKTSDSDEMCYRFNVVKWIELPEAIKPESNGPNPISYTNLFLLTICNTYPALHLKNEEEYKFFVEMKRRTDIIQYNSDERLSSFIMNDNKILFDEEKITVLKNKNVVLEYETDDFVKHASNNIRKLLKIIDY